MDCNVAIARIYPVLAKDLPFYSYFYWRISGVIFTWTLWWNEIYETFDIQS